MNSGYPIGATWQLVAPDGSVGNVWLEKRSGNMEAWFWNFCYFDGSGLKQDWNTNRKSSLEECRVAMSYNKKQKLMRFKRIK